jgi:hypothetical protein
VRGAGPRLSIEVINPYPISHLGGVAPPLYIITITLAKITNFRVVPPGDSIRSRILETDRDGPLLAATFNGRRRALNTVELLRSVFALPLVTLKIVAAIHWEARRLWLKGARQVPRQDIASNSGLAIGNSNHYTSPALSARGKE